MWKAVLDFRICLDCKDLHGKIYEFWETVDFPPPLHPFCRCEIEAMEAIRAGKGTKDGVAGADIWLKVNKRLPDNYISEKEPRKLGWNPRKGNLAQVAPGKMLKKGIYRNKNKHLPEKSGRIWYEADIHYRWGFRGDDRILYSNDGLIFVTYDHYITFVEIV